MHRSVIRRCANAETAIAFLQRDLQRRVGKSPFTNSGTASSTTTPAPAAPPRRRSGLTLKNGDVAPLTMFQPSSETAKANAPRVASLDIFVPLSKELERKATPKVELSSSSVPASSRPQSVVAVDSPTSTNAPSAQSVMESLTAARLMTTARCDVPDITATEPKRDRSNAAGSSLGLLDYRSAAFDHVRGAAGLGDWPYCLPAFHAAVASVGRLVPPATTASGSNDDDTVPTTTFEWHATTSVEQRLLLSTRLLSLAAVCVESCQAAGGDAAMEAALGGVIDALGAMAPHLPCLQSTAPLHERARGYGHVVRVATTCNSLSLYGLILQLDNQVVGPCAGFNPQPTHQTDGSAPKIAVIPVEAARQWHGELFRALDAMHHSMVASAAAPATAVDEAESPHAFADVALTIFEGRVAYRSDDETLSAAANDAAPPREKRDVIGPTAAALMVEMLQRAKESTKAGEVLAHRDLTRDTRRALNRAYSSLIGAWTATPGALRAREAAASTTSTPVPTWWRPPPSEF